MVEKQMEKVKKPTRVSVWKIVGGAAAVAVVAGLITSLSDIKRYIRISRM
jgi:hypothetical protein